MVLQDRFDVGAAGDPFVVSVATRLTALLPLIAIDLGLPPSRQRRG